MQSYIHSLTRTCQVTTVGADQIFKIGAVKKGDIVLGTALRRNVLPTASTDSTFRFALATAGLVLGAAIDPEGGVADTIAASTVDNYRCLVDDVLELRYAFGTSTGVAPQARVNALVVRNRGDL